MIHAIIPITDQISVLQLMILWKLMLETAYSSSGLSKGLVGSPGTRCFSLAQSPKSINLHLSEQKGLNLFSGVHVFFLPQCGQTILFFLFIP